MSDTFDAYRHRVAEVQDRLRYVEGAYGMAIAIGNNVVGVDLFDKPSTCKKVWNRLLSGFAWDALESKSGKSQVGSGEVKKMLAAASGMTWKTAEAVGEGEEFRAESDAGLHASALAFHGSPVHVSVVVAAG